MARTCLSIVETILHSCPPLSRSDTALVAVFVDDTGQGIIPNRTLHYLIQFRERSMRCREARIVCKYVFVCLPTQAMLLVHTLVLLLPIRVVLESWRDFD
jgi:hypothetical protein